MKKIIYAATPFRIENLKDRICDFIQEKGHFPLHPFNTLPMSRYNYDNFTREEIMKVCYGLVNISNELWIFGIGNGSLDEFAKAREINLPTKSFVKQFDPLWKLQSEKEKYHPKYSKAIKEILTT
jgi:hypothetical protein